MADWLLTYVGESQASELYIQLSRFSGLHDLASWHSPVFLAHLPCVMKYKIEKKWLYLIHVVISSLHEVLKLHAQAYLVPPHFSVLRTLPFNNPLIWQREGCLLLRREASLPMAPLTSSLPLLGWSSCLPYQGECLLCGSSVCSGGETQDAKSLRLDFKPCAKSVVYKVYWRIRVVSV